MTRGRKRKHDPTIPGHVDQKKLPTGCYWNRRDRYWYALVGQPAARRRLAGPEAMLSELCQAMEALRGVDRDSLDYMLAQFHASLQFMQLAKATQDDYGYCRLALDRFQTKLGVPVTDLRRAGITTPFLQRLVDEIAATHPAKANHVKRYLSAAFTWARQRGYATENPAQGIRAAKEKRDAMPNRAVMAAVVALLRERGALPSRRKGSVAPCLGRGGDRLPLPHAQRGGARPHRRQRPRGRHRCPPAQGQPRQPHSLEPGAAHRLGLASRPARRDLEEKGSAHPPEAGRPAACGGRGRLSAPEVGPQQRLAQGNGGRY